jgi:hypothetical protein
MAAGVSPPVAVDGGILLGKLIREPLLHFLLIGLLLFVLFNVVSGGRGGADRRIVVNDAMVGSIVQRYRSTWQRPPTPSELRGLIDSQVREEILFREGVAMGLDRDDPVIRRRVQQKLDVIAEESQARSAPSEADLAEYLGKHAERYARPAVVGFDQVMFDPVRRRANLDADLAGALARLRAGAKPDTVGDSSLLPANSTAIPADRLARDFGEDFAGYVLALPVGDWSGPVSSGYGVHLVRVNSKTPGRPATLDEVRTAVERDWENDRRVRANADYYARLRRKYDVVIDVALPDMDKGKGTVDR